MTRGFQKGVHDT